MCKCIMCQVCKEFFNEKKLEYSHDIPKYIGGVDSDGIHLLCRPCHFDYDKIILKALMDKEGEVLEDDGCIGYWQGVLKREAPETRKEIYRQIAFRIKQRYFGDGDWI